MPTPNGPAASTDSTAAPRGHLRLRMARDPGRNTFDGGWWPRSRDLAAEVADLVAHFPPELGQITRVLVSPEGWDGAPADVALAGRQVTVGEVEGDDAHVVDLVTSTGTRLRVLVVPSDLTDDQGDEALLAAATRGNRHSATDLLDTVTEHPDIDPRDHWPAVD